MRDLMPDELGEADVIKTEIKCTLNVMHGNHPETSLLPLPLCMKKLSFMKLVPDAKKIADSYDTASNY